MWDGMCLYSSLCSQNFSQETSTKELLSDEKRGGEGKGKLVHLVKLVSKIAATGRAPVSESLLL